MENIEAHITYYTSQELVLQVTQLMCNEIGHYQLSIPEKYHSFIAFDIVTCALVTIQIAKCSSYFHTQCLYHKFHTLS